MTFLLRSNTLLNINQLIVIMVRTPLQNDWIFSWNSTKLTWFFTKGYLCLQLIFAATHTYQTANGKYRTQRFICNRTEKVINKNMNNMEKTNTALVVGANGVIGTNLITYLEALGNWDIIGLSRRGGINSDKTSYLPVDLLNEQDCERKLASLTPITHIFYAAYQDKPSWAELVAPNLAMLVNVVTIIERVALNLQHISLMQGYKVYGAHYGPFKTPAKESDGGHMPPEFNVDQQQFLEKEQEGKKWTWSAIRPSVVGGTALGNPMNLVLVIAVYAVISKELGLPLRFPGKPGAYDKLLDLTDAGLLAKATVWAATNPQCANQAFNITNGDLIRWNELWPKIASYFKMEIAPPLQMPLQTIMADKGSLWKSIQQKYEIGNHSYQQVSSWGFGDFVFSWDYDFFSDGGKARRLGFHEYVETEQMFFDLFDQLKEQKIIPMES